MMIFNWFPLERLIRLERKSSLPNYFSPHPQHVPELESLQYVTSVPCLPPLDSLLQTPNRMSFHVSEGSNPWVHFEEVQEQQIPG